MPNANQIAFLKYDLNKLEAAEDNDVLLSLLASYNDVQGLGALGSLVLQQFNDSNNPNSQTLKEYWDAMVWHLYKLRVSAVADSLRYVVQDIRVTENTNKRRQIWQFLTQNPELQHQYRVLEEYLPEYKKTKPNFPAGIKYAELQKQLFVRDKMSHHHDGDALVSSLKAANVVHSLNAKRSTGWIQSLQNSPFSRFLFIDRLQSMAWYGNHSVQLSTAGYDGVPVLDEAAAHTHRMLENYSLFVEGLNACYVRKYELLLPAGKPEWLVS